MSIYPILEREWATVPSCFARSCAPAITYADTSEESQKAAEALLSDSVDFQAETD